MKTTMTRVFCTILLMTVVRTTSVPPPPTPPTPTQVAAQSPPVQRTPITTSTTSTRSTTTATASSSPFSAMTTESDELLTDTQFHCWPVIADAQRPQPFANCPGVTAYWDDIRGQEISVNVPFNLSYFLEVAPTFYEWAVTLGLFDHAGPSGFSNATEARTWCETTTCPASVREADESNCCLYYVNLHYCPTDTLFPKAPCGPWMPNHGNMYTHSYPQTGNVTTGWWSSEMVVTKKMGTLKILAMFKLARMKVGLQATLRRSRIQRFDHPGCGNGLCEQDEECDSCPEDCGQCSLISIIEIVIIVVCVFAILFLLLLLLILYHRRKHNKALKDESWVITPGEIFANVTSANVSDSKLHLRPVAERHGQHPAMSTLALPHRRRSVALLRVPVTVVREQEVVVKKYHKENFELTTKIRKEVRDVRYLNHINLCRFVGGTVEPGTVFLLYEFCPKGSLIDILLNDAISLNWAFRFSMLGDISRGMAYLHRHGMVHGNLKSANCVIDDRWICKVTDFGLNEYRTETFRNDDEELWFQYEQKLHRDRVYRAPETENMIIPASDVYSFAIIMIEMATRERASESMSITEPTKPLLPMMQSKVDMPVGPAHTSSPHDIKHNLRGSFRRGSVKGSKTNVGFGVRYQELITKCWADKPDDRPNFVEVENQLRSMHPSEKNPVDTVMGLMQMYSKNLEVVVDDRSEQLLEEKQKTEALLYSILPRQVADSLRNGQQVRAEWFEDSTVFFSDIVGFTVLSANSTPMQVVELLNKLYTTFDSIIEKHFVYKVETIGDAYMVVSGVPHRTMKHAYHVAMMALEIVSSSYDFVIPHRPQDPLHIRIGADSGPVCAGVVGVKMPRYCLFGDTVNTASRMEAYSKPYGIHISNNTYNELTKYGCFEFEPRGIISVKGKGDMYTWWLTGVNVLHEDSAKLAESGDQEQRGIGFRLLTEASNSERSTLL